jgi:hypothetical protein
MAQEYVSVDISNTPDLKRLAEAVRQTRKPHALKEGAETVAVVRPVSKREGRAGSSRRVQTPPASQAPQSDDPAFAQFLTDALAANRAEAEKTRALLAPPSSEELERRNAVAERIRAAWPYRVIAPLTTADLIHEARAQEEEAYGQPR